jgi:hypothetical protein
MDNLVNKLLKVIASLVLVILALLMCMAITYSAMFGLWLQTYQAFTTKTLVAEITVERLAPENGVERMKVLYKPVQISSAFDTFVSGSQGKASALVTEEYILYGDQVLVGGPVVKFENIPTLLGFETVYKVSRIQGSFIDTVKANNMPSGSVQDINGGIDDTWSYFEAQSEKLPWLIDTAYFSLAGKSISRQSSTYGLFITEDGFILDTVN